MDNKGILEVDIECTECGRLMALSNAFQYDHKYLCPKCAPDLDEITSSHQIPRGATVRSKTMYEQKLEQKLADLKRLVREYLNEGLYGDTQDFRNYNSLYWKLKQAVTLADDSKEVE